MLDQPQSLPFGDGEPAFCAVRQLTPGVWALELRGDKDRIPVVGRFFCDTAAHTLRGAVSPVLPVGSYLRFDPTGWVSLQRFTYQGGGVRVKAEGLEFDAGTLRRSGDQAERFDGGQWGALSAR
jgi:hypothetical protein